MRSTTRSARSCPISRTPPRRASPVRSHSCPPIPTGTVPSFQDNRLDGIGPRLGIGYMLTPKTNVRASWGLYYGGTGNQNSITPLGYQASPSFQSPNNFTPVFNWNTQPFPQTFSHPPDLNPSFANGQAVTYTTPDAARLPRVQSYTVGVAREIGRGLTMDLSYIGSRSSHLGLVGEQHADQLRADPVPVAREPAVPADQLGGGPGRWIPGAVPGICQPVGRKHGGGCHSSRSRNTRQSRPTRPA